MTKRTKTKATKAIKNAKKALLLMTGEAALGDAWHVDNVTRALDALALATEEHETVRCAAELNNAVDFAVN